MPNYAGCVQWIHTRPRVMLMGEPMYYRPLTLTNSRIRMSPPVRVGHKKTPRGGYVLKWSLRLGILG